LPIQRQDFIEIFTTMAGRPVTVRLLDPPIHEFLPTEDELREELIHLRHLKDTASGVTDLFASLKLLHAETSVINSFIPFNDKGVELISEAIVKKEQMMKKVHDLHEVNPMLGHRGVRLGLTFPEIYKMQIQAILEAAAECQQAGLDVRPEIMVPQVCTAEELVRVKAYVDEIKEKIEAENKIKLVFKFGTMIEVVRACMEAEELAKQVEFFSFGTNDLTQATFSFSREDAENKFLPMYAEKHILWDNPFEVLDIKGVGKLMKVAVEWGRKTNPELKIGICGEHGGQPDSIKFCHDLGLTYVSCSSPRVPVARLAAAHAMFGKAKNTSL
jgi:pyruvate,orthophosphate dikinase